MSRHFLLTALARLLMARPSFALCVGASVRVFEDSTGLHIINHTYYQRPPHPKCQQQSETLRVCPCIMLYVLSGVTQTS